LDEYSDAILTKQDIKPLKDILNICHKYTKNDIFLSIQNYLRILFKMTHII